MAQALKSLASLPAIRVDVVEPGARTRQGWVRCEIDRNLEFSTDRLQSYCFAQWEPVVFDALLVAAAVEFCDKTLKRSALNWGREIELRLAVHDPDLWNSKTVNGALHDALDFLTGDSWSVMFVRRRKSVEPPRQIPLSIPGGECAIIPFSDGLDSRAVAGLAAQEWGERLIRVRLGSKAFDGGALSDRRQPFTTVPYRIRAGEKEFTESSARSRGFKFALVSGVAAYLIKARQIIVPESGQGALGPALVPVGQAYEDYRNHPLFTDRMKRFLDALFHYDVRFAFPRLWHTKGETLADFVRAYQKDASWSDTWSCWQQSRHASVDGRKRQCGICAACMLRRLSVHAAGLSEPAGTYVWEKLSASTFLSGAAAGFTRKRKTGALREYAIAGALHLDHLAGLRHSPANTGALKLHAFRLSRSLGGPEAEAAKKLGRLLAQHEDEWEAFMRSWGSNSFLAQWAQRS